VLAANVKRFSKKYEFERTTIGNVDDVGIEPNVTKKKTIK
jgi:hypothetical protein